MKVSRKLRRVGVALGLALCIGLGACTGAGGTAPTESPTLPTASGSPGRGAPTPAATPTLPAECEDIVDIDDEAGLEMPEECPMLSGTVVMLKQTQEEECDDEGDHCEQFARTVAVVKLDYDAGLNIYGVELWDIEWLDTCKPGTRISFRTAVFPSTFDEGRTSFKVLTKADARRLEQGAAAGKIPADMIGKNYLIAEGYESGELKRI